MVDAAIAAARSLLEEHAETLKAQGLDVDIVVLRGDPVRQLVSTTAGANLLVIGSDFRPDDADSPRRGAHGLRIVADSSCPVVVIPDIEAGDRRGVVVGVDGSPISEAAVAFAAAEADRLGEPLIAVTVWTPVPLPRGARSYPEQYLSSMQELAEETLAVALAGLRQTYPDLELQPRVERGYPSEVINRAAAAASLAVVGSHGRGPSPGSCSGRSATRSSRRSSRPPPSSADRRDGIRGLERAGQHLVKHASAVVSARS